jgi:ubiquinone/menaquinone biosynthesis C-methylase UbiE
MSGHRTAWDTMATWLDQKHQDDGDLWHRALIDPSVFRLLGSVRGRRVLELACGNGYLARKLARLGAEVTAVDASPALIGLAKRRGAHQQLNIAYHVADAARMNMLPDRSFDVVVCNMALMNIEDAAGAIREVARVLRPMGRLIASLSHPCFDVPNASAWMVERADFETTVWRKIRRYRDVFQGSILWQLAGPHGLHRTPAFHRPLSWYFRALRDAGLVVAMLEEPTPNEECMAKDSQAEWIAQIPLHVVLEARKDV